jgi:hypothetical protein
LTSADSGGAPGVLDTTPDTKKAVEVDMNWRLESI